MFFKIFLFFLACVALTMCDAVIGIFFPLVSVVISVLVLLLLSAATITAFVGQMFGNIVCQSGRSAREFVGLVSVGVLGFGMLTIGALSLWAYYDIRPVWLFIWTEAFTLAYIFGFMGPCFKWADNFINKTDSDRALGRMTAGTSS